MPRFVHFEMPADDPERAAAFYREAFGWTVQKWDGPVEYWMVRTGDGQPGIDGGLFRREKPGQGMSNVIAVEDLDAAIERVKAAGGTVNMGPSEIPSVGMYASVSDTEGNVVGLLQPDPNSM